MVAGEWRRGRTLGRGSSATVSLAVAAPSGEFFAVKSAELSRAAPLRREQEILSGLNSPYVISYLGFDDAAAAAAAASAAAADQESPPQFNLFLEYAPGGSLSDEIEKCGGRLDEKAIRCRAYEILRGLAYLHGVGVAHCDIKGQNVLIGSEGRAKIADFGCARRVGEGGKDGRLSGTPMFMAPEVARGEEQGTAADIWALGCTVVEMATGRGPWPEFSDPVAALHHIGFSEQVPEIPLRLSEEGKDFVRKCLRRDPEERWTAELLLRHPFVDLPAAANCAAKPIRNLHDRFWISPKSTLDQGFWESESEEDEPIGESPIEDPSPRIRMLTKGELFVPDWRWDDDWIAVRSDGGGGEQTGPAADQQGPAAAADFCCGESGVLGGGGGGDVIFSIDHVGADDSRYSSRGNGFVDESRGGEIENLAEGIGVNLEEPGRFISCEREISCRACNYNNNNNEINSVNKKQSASFFSLTTTILLPRQFRTGFDFLYALLNLIN